MDPSRLRADCGEGGALNIAPFDHHYSVTRPWSRRFKIQWPLSLEMAGWIAALSILFLQILFAPLVYATLVNVTVDDDYPDPKTGVAWSYVPPDEWATGQTCSGCYVQLDKTLVHNGTWHDSTYHSVLSYAKLDFTGTHITRICGGRPYPYCLRGCATLGTAIYVYGALSNFPNGSIGGNTIHSYYIDGELVGMRTMYPSGDPTFTYNFLLYGNSSIPNGTHEFTLQNGSPDNPDTSLVLLDYAIFTT